MILKRCDNGHYYDGDIYKECPQCKGAGQGSMMQDLSFGDYADEEDTVTVALPRAQNRQQASYRADEDEPMTVALQKPQAANSGHARKPSFKPVAGWLVCVRGTDFGSSFTIRLGKNYIGRSKDMDIVLHGDDSIAMNQHAVIYYVPKYRRFAAAPGESGKLFYLNKDAVVRPVWIKQHDILRFGSASFMFMPLCGEHFSWEGLMRRQQERN